MAPYSTLAGFLGADWPSVTRYMEYQDGSFMTDGKYMDKDGTSFTSLYGPGDPTTCFQLGASSNVEECNGNGAVLCEISLFKDTHICLNNEFLSSVNLNSSTELIVPAQVIF